MALSVNALTVNVQREILIWFLPAERHPMVEPGARVGAEPIRAPLPDEGRFVPGRLQT